MKTLSNHWSFPLNHPIRDEVKILQFSLVGGMKFFISWGRATVPSYFLNSCRFLYQFKFCKSILVGLFSFHFGIYFISSVWWHLFHRPLLEGVSVSCPNFECQQLALILLMSSSAPEFVWHPGPSYGLAYIIAPSPALNGAVLTSFTAPFFANSMLDMSFHELSFMLLEWSLLLNLPTAS